MVNEPTTNSPDDEASPAGQVTEGTWLIPLAVLMPAVLIRMLTDLSTPWLIAAWTLWGLAATLSGVGWTQVARHGLRNAKGWSACLPLHCVLLGLGAHLALVP